MQLDKGFQFLSYQVLAERNIVLGPDGEQKIEPKAMRVLLFLASQPEQVVSRQALLDEVWAETYSGDEALTRCISMLRSSFGGKKNAVIETVPKVGYRFVAPIAPLESPINDAPATKTTEYSGNSAPQAVPPQQNQVDSSQPVKFFKLLLTFSIAALVLVILYVGMSNNQQATDSISTAQGPVEPAAELSAPKAQLKGTSIAVMPFVNMSGDPDNEYFSDGISEEILNILAQVPNLKVISRSSAFSFKGKDILLSEVAAKLGVNHILEGSVRKSGDRVRITAQLIEANSDTHLWSQTYDRELNDIFAVQDDITSEIVSTLVPKLGHLLKTNTRIHSLDIEAHSEYLKGSYFFAKRGQRDLLKALEHFENATVKTPNYAEAWARLAMTYQLLSAEHYGSLSNLEVREKESQALRQALAINSNLPEVLVAQASKNFLLKPVEALKQLKKALIVNPSHENALSLTFMLRLRLGDYEGLENFAIQAVERNPLSFISLHNLATYYTTAGQFSKAEKVVSQMLALNAPDAFILYTLAEVSQYQKRFGEAAWLYQKFLHSKGLKSIDRVSIAARALTDLSLESQAGNSIKQTRFSFLFHVTQGDLKAHYSILKDMFPRSDDDRLGYELLGAAAAIIGNYSEAIAYYQKSTFCKNCTTLELGSYILTGNSNAITEALLQRENLLLKAKEFNTIRNISAFRYWQHPIAFERMELAFLNRDIEEAIKILEAAVNDGEVIGFVYKITAIYKELREHPRWSELLAKSDKRVEEQQAIYYQLIETNPIIGDLLKN